VSLTKPIVLSMLIFTSACASTPRGSGSRQAAKPPLRGGVAEVRIDSYDGETMKGRVLLGATIDPLVIDRRIIPPINVEVKNLQLCDNKKDPFQYIEFDVSAPPRRPEDIITVRPGYWYGGQISYWIFAAKQTGPGPDCFEAELVMRALDGRVAARQSIRVVRTDKRPAAPDGGAPAAPKLPPSDAGAP
jgi:hypothetical protein